MPLMKALDLKAYEDKDDSRFQARTTHDNISMLKPASSGLRILFEIHKRLGSIRAI